MVELYYTPTSCGAANFIAAHKAGLIGQQVHAYEADIRNKVIKTGPKQGQDFFKVNPKGNVPTVVLDDGTVLNENAATLQYIADLAPASKLAPPAGSNARYLLISKLSWISSELHASYGPLFRPLSDEVKAFAVEKLKTKLDYLEKNELAHGKHFLLGDDFTVADSYLYIVLSWSGHIGIDLSAYPNTLKYFEYIKSLDFVQAAHAAMNQ